MRQFTIDRKLTPDTKLYRYISLESFLGLVESRHTHLTNINEWDDKWEAILSKVPSVDDDGSQHFPLYSYHERIFGQCWSLLAESDALWRIYSPNNTGLVISTTAIRFELIQGVERLYVGSVIYFSDLLDLIEKSKQCNNSFGNACLKRAAFQHEEEVRCLTHSDFIPECDPAAKHVTLKLDPFQFIDGITIDPRASNWFVDTVIQYCRRAGFRFEPVKSDLYAPDPHLTVPIATRWVPVDRDERPEIGEDT